MALSQLNTAQKRARRVRSRLKKMANGRPRLSVHRSSKNIYAQVIDDARGVTLAHASTLEDTSLKGSDKDAAARVGALIAQRAKDKGVTDVIVGFRWPYVVGPDDEPLQAKIDSLRRFADTVIAKVNKA